MTDEPREVVERVSTLELFFDLVFVFTITQLTALLVHRPDATGVFQALVLLALIWWMYAGYAWLTNAVGARPRQPPGSSSWPAWAPTSSSRSPFRAPSRAAG